MTGSVVGELMPTREELFAKDARLIPRTLAFGKAGRDRFGKVRETFPTVLVDLTVDAQHRKGNYRDRP